MSKIPAERRIQARKYLSQLAEFVPSNKEEAVLATELMGISTSTDDTWLVVDVEDSRLAMRFDALSIYWCGDDSVRLPFSR